METNIFSHVALDLQEQKPLVYTAMSCRNFHIRMLISKFVFEHGGVPVNPFTLFGYYLYELVERDVVRNGNNNVLQRCDEMWVFGEISDGVWAEIQIWKGKGKLLRYFDTSNNGKEVKEIKENECVFESGFNPYDC